jgi:hypothetical protein
VRLRVDLIGDLAEAMRRETAAGEKAVFAGISAAARGLQADWRAQVEGAGLGSRLARTIRSEAYPKGKPSLNSAGLVWTRAPKVIDAFERGALIKSTNGFYLAIPTPAAGAKGAGNKRITPGGWEQRTGQRLRFVYRRGGPSLLVADNTRINTRGRAVASRSKSGRGAMTVPIFILVPQVQLKKRLNLEGSIAKWAGAIPDLVVKNWPETP